jgi:2-oxoacid:acceptor oxidoreductase gamma subunit (pyruvate/2-ketoisovalerate family)
MIEIRFHGRGGQGAVVGSKILATAMFSEGRFVQAFPFFGIERRGAPVTAFVRSDNKKIYLRNQIRYPDHLIILDATLLKNPATFEGFRGKGWVLINHRKRPHDMESVEALNGFRVATVDASEIAIRHGLGSPLSPIVNTSILGAFARVTKLVTLESIVKTIADEVPIQPEANAQAALEAFEEVRFTSDEPNPEVEACEAPVAKDKA